MSECPKCGEEMIKEYINLRPHYKCENCNYKEAIYKFKSEIEGDGE